MDDITVILATRNRSDILRQTLAAMTQVRRSSLGVRFVVVDNASQDSTQRVLADFAARIPLVTLREPILGKNRALNRALDSVELGRIVLFTDDDVVPQPSWFEDVLSVCERWPKHLVFGGRIEPQWPEAVAIPRWVSSRYIQIFAFAMHDLGEVEIEYPEARDPFGPNFWVRREAIGATRFARNMGPHPTRRKLGGETLFLRTLRQKGHVPVYSPRVQVEHRIEPDRLNGLALYRRAVQYGRGQVYTRGLPDRAKYETFPTRWQVGQALSVLRQAFKLPVTALTTERELRVERLVRELVVLSKHAEALWAVRSGAWAAAPSEGMTT